MDGVHSHGEYPKIIHFNRVRVNMVNNGLSLLMSVSIVGGTPKWMVYEGTSQSKMDAHWGYPHLWNPPHRKNMGKKNINYGKEN